MKNKILNYRPVTWFVLANRTASVIYADKKNKPFYFIERLNNQIGTKMEGDLVADREGRIASVSNRTIRHAFEPKESKHEHFAKLFAKRIAEYLDKGHQEKKYDRLVIVAGPRFLGMLRNELKPAVRELIQHEVKHEYLQGSDQQIKKLILNAIPMREGHVDL
jgi:protein required for attachment to host cells